ncbi:thiosulfate/3-mercaptopyruvate sulfurtransferase [Streptosporangium becharense]|uniref:Thiosulfate/3-mercaptopyruvate sulfurtransferase n=1 Tax=Streptosporangium becharense TaxID=1816182 RepID=A0A7W9ME67_9ACTN|nr:rhodanese-like domain-containing protein [Streptosporangium becharense]MBB2915460.1 thiosulfate/3-mercaptopyruvate sulfurtransferase [Streptosporangium becharense]MBB5817647.1 thiosulfate/3-mercaptopyruvate sulfurtransferase [Streptosporangium becharense]
MERLLVSCEELAGLIGAPSVRIVDTRWPVGDGPAGRDLHRRARVPGAVHLGFDSTRAPDPQPAGRAADPASLAAALADLGVDEGTTVVAYDDNHQFTAARLVWLLRAHGFERAFRLDGGWPAWLRSGGPVETGPVPPPPVGSRPPLLDRPGPLIAGLDDLLAHLAAGLPVVDCRRDSSWAEEPRLIPGARRLPMRALLAPSGLRLPSSQVRAAAAAAGIGTGTPAIAYCGAAISAPAVWLTLRSAGVTGVRVYDGSITEWVSGGRPLVPETAGRSRDAGSGM